MMATTPSTPFWLEIKTEYIDANLDKVIAYLSKESSEPGTDPFYEETERLLTKRVGELVESLSGSPVGQEDEPSGREGSLAALKILGAWLLIQDSYTDTFSREVYFFFMKTLSVMVPDSYAEELTAQAVLCLTRNGFQRPAFSWADIKDPQPEVIAHKVIHGSSFSGDPGPEAWFQGKGSVRLHDGFVEIYAANKADAQFAKTASSLMLLDQAISAQTAPSDRIQQKSEDDIDVMNRFTNGFLRDMEKVSPSAEQLLKRYAEGDIATVRYLGKDFLGNLLVETVEGNYEKISGQIPFKSSAYRNLYTAAQVGQYLREGDVFDAEYKGGERNVFDLQKPFLQALLENTIEVNKDVNAVLKSVNARGLMTWWTADGYPAYVEGKDCDGEYKVGDCAVLYITGKQTNGYVYATVSGPCAEPVDEEESRKYCVEGLLYADDYVPAPAPQGSVLDGACVKGLARFLYRYQRSLGQAAERFRVLCVCRILSVLTGDSDAADYIAVSCDYLRCLMLFSMGQIEKIKPLEAEGPLSEMPGIIRRKEIVRILRCYGTEEDSDYLSGVIHGEEDTLLVQLAKLVQSCNRIDDVYPAIKTVIKREITRFLAVETEDNTDFEEAAGPNLGVENSRTEFKTSFLFAPANAYEQNQEKNIFRSLCSFLNTQEGGTLYLGVNDSGGINGLDTELEALKKKAPLYKGLDGYVRYITDRAREYFDLDVRLHFHIEPAYDNKVVAIRVDPYEHGVVEFEGTPYIRNNSESVKMSQTVRRQIEARKIASGKDKPAKNVVALTEAIREERQVVLHGYSSSSRGKKDEYTVEPFSFVGNHTYLWAYDVKDAANKLFRISRMGNVQVTGDPWAFKAQHQKGHLDIFHFSGEKPVRMVLKLDLLARNLLVEEYPDSAGDIKDLGDDSFILETDIYNILGVGRFYCGLIGHVGIVDAPGLEEYAREYFEKALEGLKQPI